MSSPEEKFGGMYDGGEPNGEPTPSGDGIAGAGHPSSAGDPKPSGDVFAVPTDYAEKGWAKDLKSYDDVYKKLDGAETLIGQKKYPDVNSTPDDWNAHYKATGRPDEAGGYEFKREGFTEGFMKMQNDEYDNAVKTIFHEAGLNQKQVDIVQGKVERLAETLLTAKGVKDVEQNKAFDELAEKTFGTNKDQIIADTAQVLKDNTPKGFEDKIAKLDNETLVILSGVLNTFKTKYINEDGSGGGAGDGSGVGETVEDLRQKARTIMQSDEYRNSFNTKSAEKRTEVAAIYEKIAKLSATG